VFGRAAVTVVVGVDPSSTKCGYAVIRSVGPRLTYLGCGVIDAGQRRPLPDRLLEIGRELHAVCDEALAKIGPDELVAAAIESGYADGHGGTALVLGAARGVAIYVMRSTLGCAVREYAPATVKKAATGSGRATKEQVAMMVARRLGMQREPATDAADALAIAICRACDGRLDRAAAGAESQRTEAR
jgi:crossover junction endodeoxyribonuclease RuvC